MTADKILAITRPKSLFGPVDPDPQIAFRKLAAIHHPDKGGDAKVFAHIKKLYDQLRDDIAKRKFSFTDVENRRASVIRFKVNSFELGEESIGRDFIGYQVGKEYADLFHNFEYRLHRFEFCNEKVKEHFKPLLPTYRDEFKFADSRLLFINKPKELIRLSDLHAHLGHVPERHVAWIISRMLNFCVYLQRHELTHNGISTDTLYVNPALHTIHPLGGWFYCVKLGRPMIAAPNKTLEYAPASLLRAKMGDIRTDLEMAKATARELLGDITGSTLYKNPSIPKPMLDWLRQPCGSDALAEFSKWHSDGGVLDKSFGPKKFIELKVSFDDVY